MKIQTKTYIMLAAAGAGSLAALSSCGNATADEQFFSFESYSLQKVAEGVDTDSLSKSMIDFDGRWELTSEGISPVKVGDQSVTALADTLAALSCVDFSTGTPAMTLPPYLKDVPQDKEAPADTVTPGSRMTLSTTVDMLTPLAAVFRVYSYAYPEGAAHGMYSTRYVNYDVVGGRVLSLSMLFNPGYERQLQPMIVERLKESKYQLLVDEDEIGISPNFRITPDGVDFVYSLYEVAPYSDGEPVVSFRAYELADLLSPTGKTLLGL
ncbi:MAG: RsiV family protein [Muribaculaceae bacterium]|nr:RsiV family protein [Muribaculaceae bacterium]